MHASSARSFPFHKDHEDLQNQWGKPLKTSAKENPLGVAVFKMAGHDRHGAWFARRSVHEGVGFARFKKAMSGEIAHTLTVQGGPGAGAVRGLAGDRRIEKMPVEGVGMLEVYQLSAQFPGPVTPRDFMTLLFTTDDALTEMSAAEMRDGKKHVPRHFMIVSKPVEHPDAPERSGFVRGQYESVELIREIPLQQAQSKSTPNLLPSYNDVEHQGRDRAVTVSAIDLPQGSDCQTHILEPENISDPELNPVEWIMITRSDPGGGIPRFLVERGTPEAMIADVSKFLNWACRIEELPDPEDKIAVQQDNTDMSKSEMVLPNGTGIQENQKLSPPLKRASTTPNLHQQASVEQQGGLISNMAHALEVGLSTYAPASVSQQIHHYLHPEGAPAEDISDESSDTSSVNSFMSAEEMRRFSTAPDENMSLKSRSSSMEMKDKPSQHEKEVLKLIQQREKLDRKLAKKRAEEESKLRKVQEKEQGDLEKTRAKHELDVKKAEEKHRKEVAKLAEKQEKEAKKAEEKRRKKEEQNKVSAVGRERDEFRSQLDLVKRENKLLLERVEDLQRENTVLAGRLGKMGPEALKGLQDEVDGLRKRAVSASSKKSAESGVSKEKGG